MKTHHTDIPIDRSRHHSQNQTNLIPPLIDRTTKTHYNLRHQPKIDYRLSLCIKKKVQTIILDSSSDTSPSTPRKSNNTEAQITTTTQYSNVTPVTPSKRLRSQIINTSSITSSNTTSRPPITEIATTPRSQTSPTNTPLVHIQHTESVERYVNYKHSTAIKTVKLQPQLKLVHIPDTEYTQLPSLQVPSEMRETSSKIYPAPIPLRKSSTYLSNF